MITKLDTVLIMRRVILDRWGRCGWQYTDRFKSAAVPEEKRLEWLMYTITWNTETLRWVWDYEP